jgi:asparagine synthase (glutamine-hydrolysing)
MPGITGIIRQHSQEEAERDLQRMVAAMRHERDYHEGQYAIQECGLYVGWMCQNGSFSDCMPLINDNRDVALIFHGESYLAGQNPPGISRGHRAVELADAQYLLRLYEKRGEDFVRELNGWFCGVVADLRKRRVILFNDRYGMSRLYVYEGRDEILFGSEAKSLLMVRSELRTIDPEALAQFLCYNCVMENKSLFKNVSLLPGGSLWSFDDQRGLKKRRYFDFKEWEQQDALQPDEFYERFALTMNRVVPTYARDNKKVALSLTAGMDTRAVMASLDLRDRSFPCYTFGGTCGETFDIAIARKLAAIYNQPYQAIKIDRDFFNDFAGLAEKSVYISDGTLHAFGAHNVYFNRIARKIAPVRLTGKYGSETVRGKKINLVSQFPINALASDLRPFLQSLPPASQVYRLKHPLSRMVAETIPWYFSGTLAVEQSQLTIRTPYMDNDLINLMFRAPYTLRGAAEPQARYINDYSPVLSQVVTDSGELGMNGPVITSLLYLVQLVLTKIEYIYLYTMPHRLTRIDRWLRFWHPENLISGRHKYEWYRIWSATHFAPFIRETLLDSQADYTRYLDYRSLSKMVKRHTAGTHNYLDEINKALTIQLICSSLLTLSRGKVVPSL